MVTSPRPFIYKGTGIRLDKNNFYVNLDREWWEIMFTGDFWGVRRFNGVSTIAERCSWLEFLVITGWTEHSVRTAVSCWKPSVTDEYDLLHIGVQKLEA